MLLPTPGTRTGPSKRTGVVVWGLVLALGAAATVAPAGQESSGLHGDLLTPRLILRTDTLTRRDAIHRADSLYDAGDARGAWAVLEARLQLDSTDYEVVWRGARAAVAVGYDAPFRTPGDYPQNRWFETAMRLGETGRALRPEGLEARYWGMAGRGRRALNAGPRHSAELGQEVFEEAHAILALDSLYAGAHHVLGVLNYRVMILSRIQRFLARLLAGNEMLHSTSWENAERYLERAAALDTTAVVYQVDYARLLARRGRKAEAVRRLRRALALPPRHPFDPGVQRRASELLRKLGG